MFKEEFETWPTNLFSNIIFIKVDIHVTNLGYLKDVSFYFIEFFNGSIKESNKIFVELDIAVIILETNN